MTATDSPHLLVVDDDQRWRALLQRYLTSNGFRVTAASDAVEARALIKSIDFDCLVHDVMMPGESGLDLTKKIKEQHPDIIIIMLTAYDIPEYRDAAYQYKANYFLSKGSASKESILTLVESILSGRQDGSRS